MTIGSILYYLIINLYKKSTPICHNNQSFLPNHLKIKSKGVALKATGKKVLHLSDVNSSTDEEVEVREEEVPQKGNGGDKDYDAIKGFIPQEQLKSFFSDRRKL